MRDAIHQAAQAEGCDFPGLGPHSFRRASVTWRQEVGGSATEASKIAGHRDLEMTSEYTFVAPERQNELTRRIQQKLAAAEKKQKEKDAAKESGRNRGGIGDRGEGIGDGGIGGGIGDRRGGNRGNRGQTGRFRRGGIGDRWDVSARRRGAGPPAAKAEPVLAVENERLLCGVGDPLCRPASLLRNQAAPRSLLEFLHEFG